MKIIGEKINGTLKKVRAAIEERDDGFIKELAKQQADAGVDWLDVNAGTSPEREPEDLLWLIDTVQSVTDCPLCLDSANPEPLVQAVDAVQSTPMINSISLESEKIEKILPVVRDKKCDVIALAMDDSGIPGDTESRLKIIRQILAVTKKEGIPQEKVYIDPLIMAVATNTESGNIAIETIRQTAAEFPEVHFCCGLSNISFGLPFRSTINQTFITLAVNAGLDTAIINPLDKKMRTTIMAVELLLGRDRHCQRYSRAAKKGLIGA